MKARFALIWKTGTHKNFEWHRTGPWTEQEIRNEVIKHSFQHVLVVDWNKSLAIGLPTTYSLEYQECCGELKPKHAFNCIDASGN